MKVYKNVLSDDLLNLVHNEQTEKMQQDVWSNSDFIWKENIKIGVTGLCSRTMISDELLALIVPQIQDKLPKCHSIIINHHIWHKNSGISFHRDQDYKFGATIYLNKNWDPNYGGIFIWKDEAEDLKSLAKQNYYGRMNAVSPTYNMMVVNTNFSWHMVTTVSPFSPENRLTLQIWGL